MAIRPKGASFSPTFVHFRLAPLNLALFSPGNRSAAGPFGRRDSQYPPKTLSEKAVGPARLILWPIAPSAPRSHRLLYISEARRLNLAPSPRMRSKTEFGDRPDFSISLSELPSPRAAWVLGHAYKVRIFRADFRTLLARPIITSPYRREVFRGPNRDVAWFRDISWGPYAIGRRPWPPDSGAIRPMYAASSPTSVHFRRAPSPARHCAVNAFDDRARRTPSLAPWRPRATL